jgi:hypothetical protein
VEFHEDPNLNKKMPRFSHEAFEEFPKMMNQSDLSFQQKHFFCRSELFGSVRR